LKNEIKNRNEFLIMTVVIKTFMLFNVTEIIIEIQAFFYSCQCS
jgi:hypothetical protein